MLSIIFSSITAFGTIVIALQLFMMIKTEKNSREELRRIKTVDVMLHWSESLERETSYAETIVEGFSKEQCKNLYECKPLEVSEEIALKIQNLCPAHKNDCEDSKSLDKKIIKGTLLSEFRWYIISYLNMLETVLTAWELKIVDDDTIRHQFQYLYSKEKDWNVLEDFRNAAGGKKAYPNIDKFISILTDEDQKGGPEKNNYRFCGNIKRGLDN